MDRRRGGTGTSNHLALLKAQAALAVLEGRWEDADTAIAGALQECEKLTDAGIANAIRDDLSAIAQARR